MSNTRSIVRRGRPRRAAAAAGAALLAGAAALGLPATAHAADPGPIGPSELSRLSDAVLQADVPGTAWHVAPERSAVVVTVDSTVDARGVAALKRSAGGLAEVMRIRRTPGRFVPYASGGDAIHGGGGTRCSLGFNVRSGGTHYFLTAGHCTADVPEWTDGTGAALGSSTGSSFPGNDYGIVRYDGDAPHPGTVGDQDITRAADAVTGQRVQRRGSTTGNRSGQVTALNASVNYGGGKVVHGLIRTDVCAEAGDSGGPLYSGSTALGLTSGGSGDCTRGGITFFQPVTEALNRYGVHVY